MTRFRCAAALLTLVVSSGLAAAADSPLANISNDADVVIRLKSPKSTTGKIATLVDKVMPGFGTMVRQNSQQLGMLISNPTAAGVDQTKDWYVVIYTNGQDEPSVVFAVPVTNAGAAQSALSDEFTAKEIDGWLFYSKDEESLPDDSTSESISAAMRGEPTTVFGRGDLSIFVNIANLSESYSDELEMAHQQALAVMEQAQQATVQGVDLEAIQKFQGQFIESMFQGVKDAEHCTIAISFADDGITAEDYLSFGADSPTAELLANHPRSDMKNLAKLPADSVILFGASTDMHKLMNWGMQMSAATAGENAELKAALAEFESATKDFKFGSMVGSLSLGSIETGLVKSLSITEISPADKYKEFQRKISAAMSIDTPAMKQTVTVEPDAETIGSVKADVITITQELDENADPSGMTKQIQAMMFGPEGMKNLVVYQGDLVIQSLGGGKSGIEAVLNNLSDSSSAPATNYRKGLIPDPNLLFLIDVPGLAMQGLRAAAGFPGLPIQIDPDQLDNLQLEKSYIGISAAADKNALRVKTRLPVEQIRSFVALAVFAQNLQQQQQQQNN